MLEPLRTDDLPSRKALIEVLQRHDARVEQASSGESQQGLGLSLNNGPATAVESLLWLAGGLLLTLLLTSRLGRGRPTVVSHKSSLATRTKGFPLSNSQACAADQRFADAIAARYDELIATLDARGRLQRRRGTTGRNYQRQLPIELAEHFGTLLRELYPARFGGATCDLARWQAWNRAADVLEQAA